ncbi:MAG: hypothetical protein OHK0011_03730 [Turneriella sp.]
MSRREILKKYFLSGCFVLSILSCSSEHNTVRLYPAKNDKAAYRQVSTDHYLYVDENHVAEAERGERRVSLVLRSSGAEAAKLFVRLKVYPDDDFAEPQLELRLRNQVIRPAALVIRREALAEQVTILESGDSLRTNPMIGNDVQAQSGYITFGKPTGAGSAKRYWQVLVLAVELDNDALSAISRADTLSLQIKGGNGQATADFSRQQLGAWQRFSQGKWDETASD